MTRAPASALLLASALLAASARANTVNVTTAAELSAAVTAAQPGDTIVLASGVYNLTAPLAASASGTVAAPIRVVSAVGAHGAQLVAAGGAEEAVRISGAFWSFDGIDLAGGLYGVRFVAGGSDGTIANALIRDSEAAAVRADCGGPDAQAHCDRGAVLGVEVTRAQTVTGCTFAGVEIVGGVGWRVERLSVHDVAVDALACPTPATAALVARGNAQQLTADAITANSTVNGLSLGPASDPCEVRGTVNNGTSCTPPTTCAVQQALVTNALLVATSQAGALFTNACAASLHGATLWDDGTDLAGMRSVELRTAGTVDVSNAILNAAMLVGSGTTQTGSGNLTLPSPTDTSFFVDVPAGNFRLVDTAPAIDKGVTLGDEPRDLDQIARPQGAAYDVGAFERPALGYPDGGIPMFDGGTNEDGGVAAIDGGAGGIGGHGGGMTQPQKENGCACDFSGSGGLGLLAPLAFVVLLLLFRRRRAR